MADSLIAMRSASLATRLAISHAAVISVVPAPRSKVACSLPKKLSSQGKTLAGSSLKTMAVARAVPRSRKAAQVRAKAVAEPLSEPLSEQLTVGGWQVDKCVRDRF
jgi:hypothetical protein